jgi:hypothetical protein
MLHMTWMQGCAKTRYPGIFKTTSGYRVRVRAVDPRTGTLKEANREYENVDLKEALLRQGEMREEIRRGSIAVERLRVGDTRSTGSNPRRRPSILGRRNATQTPLTTTSFRRLATTTTTSSRL